jgi:hypothetical protein
MEIAEEPMFLVKESGEVVQQVPRGQIFTCLNEGDRVFRKDGVENIEKSAPVNMRFGKINLKELAKIGHKYPIFLDISDYVQYGTGKLVFRNGLPVHRSDLPRICNVSKNTIDRQLKGLMKDDVIKSVRDDKKIIYFMNPYVLHLGTNMRQSLLDLFADTEYKRTCEKTWSGDKK